jgi:hypothetical protein
VVTQVSFSQSAIFFGKDTKGGKLVRVDVVAVLFGE